MAKWIAAGLSVLWLLGGSTVSLADEAFLHLDGISLIDESGEPELFPMPKGVYLRLNLGEPSEGVRSVTASAGPDAGLRFSPSTVIRFAEPPRGSLRGSGVLEIEAAVIVDNVADNRSQRYDVRLISQGAPIDSTSKEVALVSVAPIENVGQIVVLGRLGLVTGSQGEAGQ